MKLINSTESYRKGEEFENYIENNIFIDERFEMVDKTHNYQQNSKRYVVSSKKPDFTFRCRKTNKLFYVEAKFRSRFDADEKLEILDLGKFNRYNTFNKPGSPVFIAIGYEGTASQPGSISIIPLSEIKYSKLYKSVLRKYNINKETPIDSNNLFSLIKEENLTKPELNENSFKDAISLKPSKKNTFSKYLLYILTTAIILLGISFLYFKSNNSVSANTKDQIRNNILAYYSSLDQNNFQSLFNIIEPRVDRWFSRSNVDLNFIINDAKIYLRKYPYRMVDIDWKSLEITKLSNGEFNVIYNLVYKVKSNILDKYKIFYLRNNLILSSNLKIKSFYENRLSSY